MKRNLLKSQRWRPALALVLPILTMMILGGCATHAAVSRDDPELIAEKKLQQSLIIARQAQYQQRLDRVALRLRTKSVPYCGSSLVGVIGAQFSTIHDFPETYQANVTEDLGLADAAQVRWVVPNIEAGSSRLMAGDTLLRIDGVAVPDHRNITSKLGRLITSTSKNRAFIQRALTRAAHAKKPIVLDVARNGNTLAIQVTPVLACKWPIEIRIENSMRSQTDSSRIIVYSGLMQAFPDDNELAVVVGRELAHQVDSHVYKNMSVSLLAEAVDQYLGGTGLLTDYMTGPVSRNFEFNADYLGLHMTANAGFDISQAENVWRKFGISNADSLEHKMTNRQPTSPERFVVIKRTMAEIQKKQQTGESLLLD